MKKIHTFLLLFTIVLSFYTVSDIHAQLLESEFIETVKAGNISSIPGIPADYDVETYKLVYETVDLQGDTVTASGLIAIPIDTFCKKFPMGVYCHGTVLQQYNVPSYGTLDEIPINFASAGFITVAPDYLGLGESPGLHPYLHAESEATATINLIRAAREYLEGREVADNGQVFVTGYSQGGHAAMATVEYAQNNGLLEELGIVAAAPCSGSYNITEYQLQPAIFLDINYPFLGYGVYFILGYQAAYGNLYDTLDDIFLSAYIDEINLYFDGMQDEYSIGEANSALPNHASELLRDTILNALKTNPDHPLWQAVAKNDNYDWAPEFPLRMYYCTGDMQVAFLNSTTTEDTMRSNGAEDVIAINSMPGASHSGCVVPALVDAYQFFDSLAIECTPVIITDPHPNYLSVFPNPTSGKISFLTSRQIESVELYDINGRKVKELTLNRTFNMPTAGITDFQSGTYVLRVYYKSGLITTLKLIKK